MPLLLALCLLLLTAPASAQDYQGRPSVEARRADGGVAVRARMDAQAPPRVLWTLLTDCEGAQRYMRELISCRVLERGQGWDIREHRVRGWPLKPVMRNVSRVTLEADRRLAFRRIAGDWTRSDGEWRLTPIDGGRGTRVEYELDAAVPGLQLWPQSQLSSRVRATLSALRREAEADGARD
jgi:uncharacterized protein YndB with AHSA1/START domain